VALLLLGVLLAEPGGSLAAARWPARDPPGALLLWQAVGLAGGLALLGAGVTYGLAPLGWCTRLHRDPLPAAADTISAYLTELARRATSSRLILPSVKPSPRHQLVDAVERYGKGSTVVLRVRAGDQVCDRLARRVEQRAITQLASDGCPRPKQFGLEGNASQYLRSSARTSVVLRRLLPGN